MSPGVAGEARVETARGGDGSEREQPAELAEAFGKDVGGTFETTGPQCVGGSISPATIDDWGHPK